MPLKVTPNDITAILGNYIGNITFKYGVSAGPAANVNELRDAAKKFHEGFMPGRCFGFG
jgi:hypothetical protein